MLAAGPPNGAFALGLAGWTAVGRDAPALVPVGGRTSARLAANVTLVSAPFVVPERAQALAVLARAPRGGADADILARPEDGGADVPLGVIAPGPRLANHPVALAGLAGRSVRIVIDPVPALGRAVEVAGVGPVVESLPGWRVEAGLPVRTGTRPGRVLLVRDEALAIASRPFRPRRGAGTVRVSLRGDGVIAASAGGRTVRARAGARWRSVAVPVPARGPAVLRVHADPRGGELRLRDIGVVPAATRPAARRAASSGRL